MLEQTLAQIEADCARELGELERELERRAVIVLADTERRKVEAIIAAGKAPCQACNSTGWIIRLDAGYMRRFGLRDWNGCVECGGGGNEIRGRGYIEANGHDSADRVN